MKKGLTELVFILDKSGSMGRLETDTIGGYNTMLKKQQTVDGECHITTVLFNNNYELLHDRINIRAVATFHECSAMPEGWNDEIQKDYKRRGGRK